MFSATEYLEQSNSIRQWLIIFITFLLVVVLIVAILLYIINRKNLMSLGKPLSYNDQFMDSTALRTGTYTVDHLKLATIVGTFSLNVSCETNLVSNVTVDKYVELYEL